MDTSCRLASELADGLIALHIINETLDIDLHHWAPVRGWELRRFPEKILLC